MEDNKILEFMKEQYFISDEKAELSLEIAKHEKKLLEKIDVKNGYSLYIGIPFCPTTCLYCSFTSYPIRAFKDKINPYLLALKKEMEVVSDAMKEKTLDTVYIGGGTPTTLEADEFEQLFQSLFTYFDMSTVKEFTVEAGRADSITREKLEVLKKWGVDRISINPQTMKEETLKLIGRQHSVSQVKEAFALARQIGFTNINMDIILGLPEETVDDVSSTMDEIKKLGPDSLTIHTLAIKRASKMNQWMEEHGRLETSATDLAMEIATKAAREMNMEPYYLYRQKNMSGNLENTGYATKGNSGIYNILIMEEKQTIVALGAGSISKVVYSDGRIERKDNVKDVDLYLNRLDEMLERKRELLK
jgi:coproporphyrinogen dehydrogenase HemZ